MSRHEISHPSKKNLKLAYGYDRIASHYFLGIFDSDKKEEDEEEPESPTEETFMLYLMGCNREELITALKEFKGPEAHINMVALDLPIPQEGEDLAMPDHLIVTDCDEFEGNTPG